MRGKKAKRLRRVVYGKEYSSRFRRYGRLASGQVVSDERRRAYQALK